MLKFFTDVASALDALRRHAILFLLGVTIVALALLGRSWLDAHDTGLRLQSTLAAQQKTITDADQRQSTRDAQLTQTLAQISAAKQKVQTPTQAATALTQAIPQLIAGIPGGQTLPSPITIELPTAANKSKSNSAANSDVAQNSSSSPTMPGTYSVARVLEPGASPTNLSAVVNPNGSTVAPTPSNISAKYPWTSLKLELGRLGLGRAEQKGTATSKNEQGNPASQTGATSSGNSATQFASNAQTNSPPQIGTSAQGSSSTTQTNSAPQSVASTQAGPAPAIIRVPQTDLKPLYDAVEDCEVCQAKLTAAQGDLSDEKTKFSAATAQRDAAISAARGTFWTHARSAAKWLIIGAAAGAVLSRYH
jgi:hypothetical protein